MLSKIKKHFLLILISIVTLLAFTNPTQADFEKYARFKYAKEGRSVRCSRTSYFLILSFYKYEVSVEAIDGEYVIGGAYVGIFKNFIQAY